MLAHHFLKKMTVRHGKNITGFKPEALVQLENYNWPGNVRELENVVERMVILAEPGLELISPELLPAEICPHILDETAQPPGRLSPGVKTMKDAYEKMVLLETLVKSDWNQSAAARELGVNEKAVRYNMQKFAIRKPH